DYANGGSKNLALIRASTAWIWDGLGGNDNWTTAANWTANLNSPGSGDTIHFAGSTRVTPFNDNGSVVQLNQILFDSGAGSFTLGGNALTLTGGIVNNSVVNQTINMPITVSGTPTFSA